MAEKRDLNEFINELNERLYASEIVQRMIVAIFSGQSESFKNLLKDGLEDFIKDVPEGLINERLKKILNSYIRLAEGKPSDDFNRQLHLILGGKKDKED
ncbi:MAG: hypothetical protein ISS59_01055 [Desulfobacteraceae bacterium]|nr:hypothetical protein [Desulfobacteraceae bacterium]